MPLITLEELEKTVPVFRGPLGNGLASGLMNMFAMDRINSLYDRNIDRKGPDFTAAVLQDIGVRYEIIHPEVLEAIPDGPFITISNHPYGSLDGVMLVDVFARMRPDFKVMVNKFLGRIKTLEDNFICVKPTGASRTASTKDNLHGIKDALDHVRKGHPLGIFPSGAVSDLSIRDRCIRDRGWQEAAIRLIGKLGVPVVPVHFLDRNSDFYYMLGLINWRVRLLRLPLEVFNKRGELQRIVLGPVVTPAELAHFAGDVAGLGEYLRSKVYNLY